MTHSPSIPVRGLLRRLAALVTVVLVLGAGLALYTGRAVEEGTLRPELREAAEMIGGNVAQQIERALALGVPLSGLVDVAGLFDDVIASNPLVEAMDLRDPSGRTLTARGDRAEAELTVSVPVGASGAVLLVAVRAPDPGAAPLWRYAELLAGAVAVLSLAMLALRRIAVVTLERPMRVAAATAAAFSAGDLRHRVESTGSGAPLFLLHALADLVGGTRRRAESLRRTIGEVQAAHFDPAILGELDTLDRRVQATLGTAESNEPATSRR